MYVYTINMNDIIHPLYKISKRMIMIWLNRELIDIINYVLIVGPKYFIAHERVRKICALGGKIGKKPKNSIFHFSYNKRKFTFGFGRQLASVCP